MTVALTLMATVETGEVVTLDGLASEIHGLASRQRSLETELYEVEFAIGRALSGARHLLPSDQAFGAWFRAQAFEFKQSWGSILRRCAENEQEVRAAVSTQVLTGEKPNLREALQAATSTAELDAPDAADTHAQRRRPLPDQFRAAMLDLDRLTDRIDRLVADDRFKRNFDQITETYASDLVRARDALQRVIDQLSNGA